MTGVVSGGARVAKRLAHDLGLPEYGIVNVAMYRDSYAKESLHIKAQPTMLPFDVNECRIPLVDDVLASGCTIHAAINKLFDYGRPATMELAVLVDCGGRRLPVTPDYIGERITPPADEPFALSEAGGSTAVRFTFTCESKSTRL